MQTISQRIWPSVAIASRLWYLKDKSFRISVKYNAFKFFSAQECDHHANITCEVACQANRNTQPLVSLPHQQTPLPLTKMPLCYCCSPRRGWFLCWNKIINAFFFSAVLILLWHHYRSDEHCMLNCCCKAKKGLATLTAPLTGIQC